MPFTPAFPPSRRHAALLAAVLGTVAPGVRAQQGSDGDQGPDHVLVVARTVQPRIAYRGIPLEDHPVHTRATVFPGGVFHRTLDASMERLVGDAELSQLGSLGIERGVGPALTMGRAGLVYPGLFAGGAAGATMPLLSGSGGAVSAATRGLGSMIQDSMVHGSTIHGSVLPVTAKNPGGGP